MKGKILFVIDILFLLKSAHSKLGDGDAKIINGKKASIKDYAYAVSISDWDNHICGGSIITNYHVLTACHCMRTNKSGLVSERAPDTLSVRAGCDNIMNPSGIHQDRRVSQVVSHPKCRIFDFSAIYDVSCLILKQRLKFNNNVQPIKLPFSLRKNHTDLLDVRELSRKRLYCYVAGWGKTEQNPYSETLLEISVPLTPLRSCSQRLLQVSKGTRKLDNSRTEICTDNVQGKDACLGDSGGALRCGKFIVGIVSWGFDCGTINNPSVFANVLKLKEFIGSGLRVLPSIGLSPQLQQNVLIFPVIYLILFN